MKIFLETRIENFFYFENCWIKWYELDIIWNLVFEIKVFDILTESRYYRSGDALIWHWREIRRKLPPTCLPLNFSVAIHSFLNLSLVTNWISNKFFCSLIFPLLLLLLFPFWNKTIDKFALFIFSIRKKIHYHNITALIL